LISSIPTSHQIDIIIGPNGWMFLAFASGPQLIKIYEVVQAEPLEADVYATMNIFDDYGFDTYIVACNRAIQQPSAQPLANPWALAIR
jgi:hypothetical protein